MTIRGAVFRSTMTCLIGMVVVFVVFYYCEHRRIRSADFHAAMEAIDAVVSRNCDFSKEFVKEIPLNMEQIQTRLVADDLADLLPSKAGMDYASLRRDSSLQKLAVRRIKTLDGNDIGYFCLVDVKGVVILHPNSFVQGMDLSGTANKYPALWGLIKMAAVKGSSEGFYEFLNDSNQVDKKYMDCVRVRGSEFLLLATIDVDKYVARVDAQIRGEADQIREETRKSLNAAVIVPPLRTLVFAVAAAAIMLAFGGIVSYYLSGRISSPILSVMDAARLMGKGDFQVKVPETGVYELRELAGQFNKLGAELSSYVIHLETAIKSREAIEGELRAAAVIQRTLLPDPKSVDGILAYAEVAGRLIPAKRVAGDFYDFFQAGYDFKGIGGETLVLLVGDVSDKGTPSALFMAVCITLVRAFGKSKETVLTPSGVLDEVNNALCEGNDGCMFVTLFLCFYNVKSGELSYANAGHHEAVIFSPDGGRRTFGVHANPPLGLFKAVKYADGFEDIAPGETLALFTDGATEAFSPSGVILGMDGTLDILSKHVASGVDGFLASAEQDIINYQADHLSDDLTLLAMRRHL